MFPLIIQLGCSGGLSTDTGPPAAPALTQPAAGGASHGPAEPAGGSQPSKTGVVAACNPAEQVTAGPSQLLSRDQLAQTLRTLLYDESIAATDLPADTSAGHFVHASSHRVNADYLRQYQSLVERASIRAASERLDQLAPCLAGNELACGAQFVEAFLPRAFRRPASEQELAEATQFFSEQLQKHDYATAIAQTLQAVLLDANTVYRLERSASTTADENGLVPLDSYALASRIAYVLTGSPPDESLYAAAAAGNLNSDEQIQAQAERLLQTTSGRRVFEDFTRRWLGLNFDKISKSPALLDGLIEQDVLIAGLDQSFSAFMDHVMGEGGATLQALLTSEALHLPQSIEPLYAEPGPRAGLLTHPALMAQFAHDHSSPVLRGVFVRDHVMCSPVPPPPAVSAKVPEAGEIKTTRERYGLIEQQPSCQGCHLLIHSIGFSFENYDGLGRYRQQENGVTIDSSGSFQGFGELSGEFAGAVELGQRLAQSERVAQCLTKNLYEAGAARAPDGLDNCEIQRLSSQLVDPSGFAGDLRQLLIAMLKSQRFRTKPAEDPPLVAAPEPNGELN